MNSITFRIIADKIIIKELLIAVLERMDTVHIGRKTQFLSPLTQHDKRMVQHAFCHSVFHHISLFVEAQNLDLLSYQIIISAL